MRKILCGILAFIICCFSVISLAEDYDMQKEQEDIKNKINQSTNELQGVQDELSESMKQIQGLDEKILGYEITPLVLYHYYYYFSSYGN